jgi:hypothetical protein
MAGRPHVQSEVESRAKLFRGRHDSHDGVSQVSERHVRVP